jgi:hypothetical protein
MDLMDYLKQAKSSLFRYESLQDYPDDFFDNADETMKEWWDFIRLKVSEGVKMERVRLITQPITEYVQTELRVHAKSALYGDSIKTINEKDFLVGLSDFWLVDDKIVLLMNYDSQGHYLSFDVKEDDGEYRNLKLKLLDVSIPLVTTN